MATKTSSRSSQKKSTTKKKASKKAANRPQTKKKVHKVMKEYKEGKLHTRSKKGPIVRSRKQAIAIALSEAGVSKKSKKSKAKKA